MKRKLLFSLFLCFFAFSQAQTDGNLTFTFNHSDPQTGDRRDVIAVWVESSTGTFIKTKMRYVGSGTSDHLTVFAVQAGGTTYNALHSAIDVTDATTGATRVTGSGATTPPAWGSKTVIWDGKDLAGVIVADGDYNIFIESAWVDGPPNSDYITNFTFTKGPAVQNLTPAGDAIINAISLDWVPANLSIEDNTLAKNKILVYPNPSSGVFNINFKNNIANKIEVLDLLGRIVYQEKMNSTNSEYLKNLDLSSNVNGIYILKFYSESGISSQKIVIR